MNLYGVWFPYDDNTKERLCTFKSNISLINAQMKMHKAEETVVIGDFNADLERGKRFDLLLKKFVNKNHMYDGIGHLKKYTYKKGEYTTKLDHILLRDKSSLTVSSCSILDSLLDASDHKPIQVILNYEKINTNSDDNTKKFHKFNWKNCEFIEKYKQYVNELLDKEMSLCEINNFNYKITIENNLRIVTKVLIKSARNAENKPKSLMFILALGNHSNLKVVEKQNLLNIKKR